MAVAAATFAKALGKRPHWSSAVSSASEVSGSESGTERPVIS